MREFMLFDLETGEPVLNFEVKNKDVLSIMITNDTTDIKKLKTKYHKLLKYDNKKKKYNFIDGILD